MMSHEVPWDTQELRAAYERGFVEGMQEQLRRIVQKQVEGRGPCPNCGGFDYVPQHTLYTGIETTYQSCNDCDHHWGHE